MDIPMRTGLALGTTILFWSSSFPIIRIGLESYGPVELTSLRYVVASLLLIPITIWRRPQPPTLADVPSIIALGILGITSYHLLLSHGQQTISAGAAGVLSNTSPMFTALLGVAFLRERLSLLGWIGIVTACIGASMIASAKNERLAIDVGAILVLLAAGTWSLYFVGQKMLLARYGALDLMTYVIWSGTLILLPLAPAAVTALRSAPLTATIAVVYLGTFPTIVAYAAWAYVLSQMPVSVAASALFAVPVLAMLLSWLALGEVPSIVMTAGAALAICGTLLVNVFGRQIG